MKSYSMLCFTHVTTYLGDLSSDSPQNAFSFQLHSIPQSLFDQWLVCGHVGLSSPLLFPQCCGVFASFGPWMSVTCMCAGAAAGQILRSGIPGSKANCIFKHNIYTFQAASWYLGKILFSKPTSKRLSMAGGVSISK